jgi:hypothetical protein
MLRWPNPSELPQALDAVSHPEVAAALEGAGAESDIPWGFTMPQGDVLLFLSRGEQRCLLRNVKASTAHLIGTESSPPPLTSVECQGIRESVKELLCLRLRQASATNPRADATGRWLTCPTDDRPTRCHACHGPSRRGSFHGLDALAVATGAAAVRGAVRLGV